MKYLLSIVISIVIIALSLDELLKMEASWSVRFIALILVALFFSFVVLFFILKYVNKKKI